MRVTSRTRPYAPKDESIKLRRTIEFDVAGMITQDLVDRRGNLDGSQIESPSTSKTTRPSSVLRGVHAEDASLLVRHALRHSFISSLGRGQTSRRWEALDSRSTMQGLARELAAVRLELDHRVAATTTAAADAVSRHRRRFDPSTVVGRPALGNRRVGRTCRRDQPDRCGDAGAISRSATREARGARGRGDPAGETTIRRGARGRAPHRRASMRPSVAEQPTRCTPSSATAPDALLTVRVCSSPPHLTRRRRRRRRRLHDAVRSPDSTLTLIVGDVQGKGIEAATLTALARHTLRAGALDGHGPARLLTHLNKTLLYGQQEQAAAGREQPMRFVTAAAARLTPSTTAVFDLAVLAPVPPHSWCGAM